MFEDHKSEKYSTRFPMYLNEAPCDAIKKPIELGNWNFLFSNKSVHEQVTIFNQTLMNIFSNYIPNKLITVDDKDPPWMNESIKKNIMAKKNACKSFNANKKNYDAYLKLQTISTKLSEIISKKKRIITVHSLIN